MSGRGVQALEGGVAPRLGNSGSDDPFGCPRLRESHRIAGRRNFRLVFRRTHTPGCFDSCGLLGIEAGKAHRDAPCLRLAGSGQDRSQVSGFGNPPTSGVRGSRHRRPDPVRVEGSELSAASVDFYGGDCDWENLRCWPYCRVVANFSKYKVKIEKTEQVFPSEN